MRDGIRSPLLSSTLIRKQGCFKPLVGIKLNPHGFHFTKTVNFIPFFRDNGFIFKGAEKLNKIPDKLTFFK